MNVTLEYGHGTIDATVPDTTDIFVPGETVADPVALADPKAATAEALRSPLGMQPISRLVGKSSKVAIVFPDRVKGGFQETSHRKIAIPLIVESCVAAGVQEKNISLICSNGLHRKMRPAELRAILGEAIYERFSRIDRIFNHDSENPENLIDLGEDHDGNPVIMNRMVYDADLPVLIGHTLGNPYGGYSGGYKHCATGITHWRSIASHHTPSVMHGADFTPVSSHSRMRQKFDSIGTYMEERMKKSFFICDAVLDTKMRQIAVFAGTGSEVQTASWKIADRRTYVPWATKKYQLLLFGMPQSFHYGDGHGTNPILILQAIAANIIRHKRILAENLVIICSSLCNGYFHDEEFTGYRDLYELYQHDYHQSLPDLAVYGEYFATRKEYIDKYRFGYGYHPFHAFSMVSCGHIAHLHTQAIYLVGAMEPGFARGMGMRTCTTFEEALADAARFVGPSPAILALPRTFKTAAVHLCMADDREFAGRAGE